MPQSLTIPLKPLNSAETCSTSSQSLIRLPYGGTETSQRTVRQHYGLPEGCAYCTCPNALITRVPYRSPSFQGLASHLVVAEVILLLGSVLFETQFLNSRMVVPNSMPRISMEDLNSALTIFIFGNVHADIEWEHRRLKITKELESPIFRCRYIVPVIRSWRRGAIAGRDRLRVARCHATGGGETRL